MILATVPSGKAMTEILGGLAVNGKLVIIGGSDEPIQVPYLVESSFPLQPSPSSNFEEYLLRCEPVVLFSSLFILHHFFLRLILMLLLVFLSIYQLRTIQPIATTIFFSIIRMNVGACSLRLWIGLVSTLIFISIHYFCDSGAQAISLPRIEEIDDNRYWAIAGDLDTFFRNITSN